MQHGRLAGLTQLEHGSASAAVATVEIATDVSCAVEIACLVSDQPCNRSSAIGAPREVVQHSLFASVTKLNTVPNVPEVPPKLVVP